MHRKLRNCNNVLSISLSLIYIQPATFLRKCKSVIVSPFSQVCDLQTLRGQEHLQSVRRVIVTCSVLQVLLALLAIACVVLAEPQQAQRRPAIWPRINPGRLYGRPNGPRVAINVGIRRRPPRPGSTVRPITSAATPTPPAPQPVQNNTRFGIGFEV